VLTGWPRNVPEKTTTKTYFKKLLEKPTEKTETKNKKPPHTPWGWYAREMLSRLAGAN
jgi:hypothetical protein